MKHDTIKIMILFLIGLFNSVLLHAQERVASPKNTTDILKWVKDGKTTKIIFPAGTYNFSDPITLKNDKLILEGSGIGKTVLKLTTKRGVFIDAVGDAAFITNLTIDGGDNQKSFGNCIFRFNKSKSHHFEEVEFTNSIWNAIAAQRAYATDGLVLKNCIFSNIDYYPVQIFNRNTNLRGGELITSVKKVVIDGCVFKEGYECAINSDNGNDREDSGDGTGRRYTESTSLNGTIIQNCIFGKSRKFNIGMVQTADVIIRNNQFMGIVDNAGGGCQAIHLEQCTHNMEIYDNTFQMPNTVSKNYLYIRISGTEGHKRATQQRPSDTYKSWTYYVHGSNERRANIACATEGNINKDCKRDVHAYGPRNIYIAGNTFNASEKVSQYLSIGEGENIRIGTKKDGTVALNQFLGGTTTSKKISLGGHDEGCGDVLIKAGQNITKKNIDIKKVHFDLPPIRIKKPIIIEE
ncbi:hypothetical protein FHR24_002306 [Wenyingzhuangia heitensis]|uniref:Right handed beta helix region n=1 Tax=Wenyingzhuangia heitensis TaxID=1487859 RepID=A0ABX0UDC8_9FLAO|nr:right-handed parallel beta-helix repeat-containing protein [Wenyingzhuangia heitensis]NIJ45835.1 hypothetical protein [Wenyingzhuangia heitensis]